MAVRCSKCGEELLGAVNRCWKCGQTFSQRPEIDGRPPVQAGLPRPGQPPLEAIVVETGSGHSAASAAVPPLMATSAPLALAARRATTAELIDARRASMMAMGGTVASLVLGAFAALLALAWPMAALIALIGLVMGIWGLYSPRRNLALAGMLLCCLAIGVGTYGLARNVYIYVQSQKPTPIDNVDPMLPDE